MAKGDPVTSPWMFYDSGIDSGGKKITGTVTFDGSNNLTGGTVVRDVGCLYAKIIVGALNPDGTPAAGAKILNVPAGTTTFTKTQLNAAGLVTVNDIKNAPQITASP